MALCVSRNVDIVSNCNETTYRVPKPRIFLQKVSSILICRRKISSVNVSEQFAETLNLTHASKPFWSAQ